MSIKCYEESTAQLGSVMYGILKSECDDVKVNKFLQQVLASWSPEQIAKDSDYEGCTPAQVKADGMEITNYLIDYLKSNYPWAEKYGKKKMRGLIRESFWLYVAHANFNLKNASILTDMDMLFMSLPAGKILILDKIVSWVDNLPSSRGEKTISFDVEMTPELQEAIDKLKCGVYLGDFGTGFEVDGVRFPFPHVGCDTAELMVKRVEDFIASGEQKPQVHVVMPNFSETLSSIVVNGFTAKFHKDLNALIAEFEDGIKMAQDIASSEAPDSIKGTARHRLEIIRQRAINGTSKLSKEDLIREVVNLCATAFVDESLYLNVTGVIESRELPDTDVCGLRSGLEGTNALYCREFIDLFADNISGILAKKFKELTGRERGSVVLQGNSSPVVLTVANGIVSCERLADYNQCAEASCQGCDGCGDGVKRYAK